MVKTAVRSGFRWRAIRLFVLLTLALNGKSNGQQAPATANAISIGIRLPGYDVKVAGRWLGPTEKRSGIPLGGLGTGFLELRPDCRFYDAVLQNNWIKPKAAGAGALQLTCGGEATTLLSSSSPEARKPSTSLPLSLPHPATRYLGHYPIADIDFGRPTSAPISVWIRAYSPFVPQNAELSNTPAAIFSVRVKNLGNVPTRISLSFWWENDLPDSRDSIHRSFDGPGLAGVRMSRAGLSGGYAIAARSAGATLIVTERVIAPGKPSRARVVVDARLGLGEERRITFALAWHFPTWRSGNGQLVLNRYAVRFADAEAVARAALDRSGTKEQAIIDWQSRFYSRDLPAWLKDGLVNGLYLFARSSIWLDDGRLLVCDGGPSASCTESLAARFAGSFPLLLLFTEQEKRIMREYLRLQKAEGEMPSALGGALDADSPMLKSPLRGPHFVLLAYRDWLWTQDRAFMGDIYPPVKRALQYAMKMDLNGDGLVDEAEDMDAGSASARAYDKWPWYGTSSYSAGIGLAALRAGEELAKQSGDVEFAAWCRVRFEKGSMAFEEDLWNGSIYRLYTDPEHFRQSETSLANQLCGQWYAWLCDLGDLHRPANAMTALRTVASLNGRATTFGTIGGCKPDGMAEQAGGLQSMDIIPSDVWSFAGTALMAARKFANPSLRLEGLKAAEAAYTAFVDSGMLWNQHYCIDAKDGRPLSGPHYSGSLSLWALPFCYDGVPMRPHAAPE